MKKFQFTNKLLIWSAALLLILSTLFVGCDVLDLDGGTMAVTEAPDTHAPIILHQLTIEGDDLLYMEIGDTHQLRTDAPEAIQDKLKWSVSSACVGVTQDGQLTAQALGQATVTVEFKIFSDSITVWVVDVIPTDTDGADTEGKDPSTSAPAEPPVGDPTQPDDPPSDTPIEPLPPSEIWEAIHSPEGYKPAGSYEEALNRTQNGQLSGYPYVPDQAPIVSEYRPMEDGKYVKNNDPYYIDDNTYVVVDAYGREVFRIYRGGAYITLEEVAAYVWAFGDIPANHSTSKKTSPTSSIWGEYLRVNHTKFSGDTGKYPYEPALPRISGCGGDFTYYELDIGTTGTDCDPGYNVAIYNNGSRIVRGAARIVHARFDRNGNKIIDPDEKYVFYTYNHYNDYQEYLNYYGGWGEMFGNVTGGGTLSSKYDYNPTPYVPVVNRSLRAGNARILPVLQAEAITPPFRVEATLLHCDFHRYRDLAA